MTVNFVKINCITTNRIAPIPKSNQNMKGVNDIAECRMCCNSISGDPLTMSRKVVKPHRINKVRLEMKETLFTAIFLLFVNCILFAK